MERKMKKVILDANVWLWIGSVFALLLGISGIVFSIFPNIEPVVPREFLQTKEVTVSVLDYHSYRSGNVYYILTTDGEKYNISGSYQRDELLENISTGKNITVKWYQSKPFGTLLAEEIFADGKQVAFYNNDKVLDRKISFFLGCFTVFLGLAGFAAIRYDRKLGNKSPKKGNGRIGRKSKKKSGSSSLSSTR